MDLRAIGPFGFAATLLASSLFAQQPSRTGSVDEQVQEMRRQLTEGKTFRSHVRVTVRLKNGNRITGIVKDGFVIERIDGIRFVAAEASEAGAGIRVLYWNGKGNYVFLPFSDIQEYRINARVTAQELAVIEREEREREAAEKARQLAEKQNGPVPPVGQPIPPLPAQPGQPGQPAPVGEGAPVVDQAGAPAPAGETPVGGVAAELQTLFALTQEFPPAAGWSQQKRDELARKQAVVGSKPTAQEQRFLDNFANWQRACALFGTKSPTEGDNAPEPTNGKSRRGSRGK